MTEAARDLRRAAVYVGERRAGELSERPGGGFRFAYDSAYLADSDAPSVSLTLPRRREPYDSEVFFPFFYGLLAEGATRGMQCRTHRVDEEDFFGLLLAAGRDAIGAVKVVPS